MMKGASGINDGWPSIPSGEVTGTTLQGREKYDGPGTAKEEATQFPPRSL